ncbi:hypothetical protein FRC07_006120 [Ceratobasidium sp. 392]|nr:hypothetical protein FRC07_006120 [Ceratobasidium sp. 392]
MPDYSSKCSTWSDDQLVAKEVSHRRSIASYITSLTLTAGTTAATMGAAAPLTVPIGGFKLYKINSHRSKLKTVRAELAKRNLSPEKKRKRDVLVPVSVTFTVYVATFGLADVVDIVPSDVQGMIQGHVDDAFGLDQGTTGQGGVGDKYQAFIMAEAANAALMRNAPSPSQARFLTFNHDSDSSSSASSSDPKINN